MQVANPLCRCLHGQLCRAVSSKIGVQNECLVLVVKSVMCLCIAAALKLCFGIDMYTP